MITKELRKYVWDKVPSKHLEDLIDIADAIEQKHEEELAQERAKALMMNRVSAANGFIELPKDADGEIIRLGNVLEWQGASFTVEVLELDEEGWWTRHDGFSVKCSDARHVQPDSWERIIRDAQGDGILNQIDGRPSDFEALVERCKRLAGEDA